MMEEQADLAGPLVDAADSLPSRQTEDYTEERLNVWLSQSRN